MSPAVENSNNKKYYYRNSFKTETGFFRLNNDEVGYGAFQRMVVKLRATSMATWIKVSSKQKRSIPPKELPVRKLCISLKNVNCS